eukprot:Skav233820  [mRNA]  locus=scaffold5904:101738:103764:+ [translate_table: standard]
MQKLEIIPSKNPGSCQAHNEKSLGNKTCNAWAPAYTCHASAVHGKMDDEEPEELPAVVSVNFGVELEEELQPDAAPPSPSQPVKLIGRRSSTERFRSTLMSVVNVHARGTNWSAVAQDAKDFSHFFGGLAEGSEGAYIAGLSCRRMTHTLLTVQLSTVVVASFFAVSLVLSGIWAVPGHEEATFWKGFMNRIAWAFSPVFLGGFFPGLCNPVMMLNWRIHRYFIIISLLPFIIADVAFPYIVGTDSHFKVSRAQVACVAVLVMGNALLTQHCAGGSSASIK